MNIYAVILTTFAAKFLFSVVVYKKNKHVFKRMSLPTKGAVIGGSWAASYGLLQLINGII
ncbi:hypothetical protein [Scandinavium goeteborgense]|uniref:Uncharacterized protein n=1 Tax=Scandinavium goeteborgense TaxID=1851514 RepID=A0A4R6E1F3_SCAGO|nr:hypothetical protein [Scandinavium goeteborgense]TDN51541.1 hypothetical protein EC847_11712 [Scandinavium goeteborgense]